MQDFIDWEPVGAPGSRRRRRAGANRRTIVGTALLVAGLASSFAVAAPGGSDQPVRAVGDRPGTMLRAVNTGTGIAATLRCVSDRACLTARNQGDGPAARFATKAGVAPFRVPFRSGKVPHLNADSLDGLGASEIIRTALERSAGGREPAGPAGGDLNGTYPNPTIAKDGAPDTPTLRSLGTSATTAAAGNDPRLSDARTPSGPAGGDLNGTFPNPTIAKDGPAGTPTLRSLGTTANTAAAGNDPRFNDPSTPAGPAGGDLTGTYPNPTLGSGSIDSAALFASALIDGAANAATLRTLGTGAQQAVAGNDPRLSNSRTPTGPAGGDLTGSFPNPTLGNGSIDSTALFTAALTDGAAGTATLRSLGTGANQAAAGNDPRLSDSRTPSGAAGGDLTGSYPNPEIGSDAITGAQVTDGSLRLGDLAVFGSSFNVNATLGANTCGVLGADLSGVFDIQDGDIIEVYQRVDDFPAGVILTGGTQNADETVRINVCNNSPTNQSISGAGAPFRIYR